MCGIASGACFNYVVRVRQALADMYSDVVGWPDEDKRRLTDFGDDVFGCSNCPNAFFR
ncbi:TPA: hypothetical protein N0F65_005580 [Lagenidium giganteum]|uniref:Uncharacterized protein n=1 Tax=Lagenidium giganteum TaxID=4803 RepID=A0AAV2Z4Z8_9STRA|nr:TPA: hypothetical protein N0F65_005580 [Lagenidium giganteum]